MKEQALKQLSPISIDEIKKLLKANQPDKFDKMIITQDQEIKRTDYTFVKYKYQLVERSLKLVKFPLYGSLKNSFGAFTGGISKHGEKTTIESDDLLISLSNDYGIVSNEVDATQIDNPFDFPFDVQDKYLLQKQSKYFHAAYTFQETCKKCKGNKYVTCSNDECKGRHQYTCPTCKGDRKVDCRYCEASGMIRCNKCDARGEYKCSKCSGKGQIKCSFITGCGGSGKRQQGDKKVRCSKCYGKGYSSCSECRQGIIKCEKCATKGEIRCKDCSGKGNVDCNYCDAAGEIICSTCYGDKERYGMIDCSTCRTMGIMAQMLFTETEIRNLEKDKIISNNKSVSIDESKLLTHVITDGTTKLAYNKANEHLQEAYDEFNKAYTSDLRQELNLNKKGFPLLTRENMYYQMIPCISFTYKHMLTNTTHEIIIVNFWEAPEISFSDEPEQLKQDLGSVAKSTSRLFGKLFKTKTFKTKQDRRNEIVLLIHLAKADGKIDDQEKIFLSDLIGGLKDFTNSEKQNLFDLIDAASLPQLILSDVTFSRTERSQEVLKNLKKLAAADGETSIKEEELINEIKDMMS